MTTSTLITPRHARGGATTTVDSPFTGNRLRIVREHPDDVSRNVYVATEHGNVLLGSVVAMGGGSFYALPPLGLDGGWPATSFRGGAESLDVHLSATPVTTYLLTARPEGEPEALLVQRAHDRKDA